MILIAVIALNFVVSNAYGDVIIRESNSKEGSVCFLNNGTRGICRATCQTQSKDEYEPNVCHAGGDRTLYCCLNKEQMTRYPTIEKVCMDQILTEDCNQQSLDRPEGERDNFMKECVKGPMNGAVTSGMESKRKLWEYPYLVAIGLKTLDDTIFWVCTGALIHDEYILVKGRCVQSKERRLYLQLYYFGTVRIGYPDLNSAFVEYYIANSYLVPHYSPDSLYNNLAILKLRRAVWFENKLAPRPVCIWTEKEFPTQNLTSVGFTNFSWKTPDQSEFVQLRPTILPQEECHLNIATLSKGILDSQLCTKSNFTVKGFEIEKYFPGPLTFTDSSWLNMPYLVGMHSFIIKKLNMTNTVESRIFSHLDWIESVISGSLG